MKQIALAVLTILAVAALAAFAPPYPKVPHTSVAVVNAGTTVRMKWTIAATPSDSLTADLSATGQLSTHRMYLADTKTDSIDYPKPAPGGSVTLSFLGKNCRVGRCVAAPLFSQTYVEPDSVVVPPSVTVTVSPTSVTLPPGGTQQFTATIS